MRKGIIEGEIVRFAMLDGAVDFSVRMSQAFLVPSETVVRCIVQPPQNKSDKSSEELFKTAKRLSMGDKVKVKFEPSDGE